MSANPGYMMYPNQYLPGQSPMPKLHISLGQQQHQPHGNPSTPGETGHQLQYLHTQDRKVPLNGGPQIVPTDPMAAKSSFEPTINVNYPIMSNPETQANAAPSFDSHDFTPQVSDRLPITKSAVLPNIMAASNPGHSDTMDSVYKSSDSASIRTNEQGKDLIFR